MTQRHDLVESLLAKAWREFYKKYEYKEEFYTQFNPDWTDEECLSNFHIMKEEKQKKDIYVKKLREFKVDMEEYRLYLQTFTLKELQNFAKDKL